MPVLVPKSAGPAVVLVSITMSSEAYAYLDPGTGSMVLQALIAGVLGSAFAVKMFWHRIVSLFRGSKADRVPEK